MIKKITLSLVLLASVTSSAFAQKVKYGIKAGVSLASMAISEDLKSNIDGDSKFNTSLFISGNAEIAISKMFSFQPAITLIGKGAKFQEKETRTQNGEKFTLLETMQYNLMNLDVPLNVVARIPAGKGKVFIGAGPYVGFALGAKFKMLGEEFSNKEGMKYEMFQKVDFGSEEDEMNRLDFGANLLAGYELAKGYNINAGYSFGFKNIMNTSTDEKMRNRVLTIGLGYSF